MPASRSVRATILTPRSCPSSPTLAMMTRMRSDVPCVTRPPVGVRYTVLRQRQRVKRTPPPRSAESNTGPRGIQPMPALGEAMPRSVLPLLIVAVVAVALGLTWWTLGHGSGGDTAVADQDLAPFRRIEVSGAAEVM